MSRSAFPRRRFLQNGCAALGLSLPELLRLREQASANYLASGNTGKAKSCIVLYCWGGMSHHETWDPKPLAPREVRGEFQPIATATPGTMVSEHIPHLARQTERLAIVRSIHHNSSAHGKGMYWNMTGHAPPQATTATNIPPTPEDWPSLGAMISKFRAAPRGMPRSVRLPYPLVDNGTLQAGEYGGWMGQQFDPIVIRTPGGKPFGGVSRSLGAAELNLSQEVDLTRLTRRNHLLANLEIPLPPEPGIKQLLHFRQLASDMLLNPKVKVAFDLDNESPKTLERYGNHIGGRSMLLARRLSEAGVPLVTVCCAAGDLNGSRGDHWDTHGDNFNRLKNTMLPSFDRPAATLLDDLADRGLLDHTLVVIMTEFGRTPKINGGAGRDHYPGVYSVVLAGGGIQGGQVYGSSDRNGAHPHSGACKPNDLHATIFTAMGIPPHTMLYDSLNRPLSITDGRPLPLFG
jgi:hypothetical protein